MRVLAAISFLAFLALLWASIAIFRHIRRAHRHRSLEASSNNLVPTPAAIIIAPPAAPPVVPEVAFTDSRTPIREPMTPAFQPYLRQSEVRQPVLPPASLVIHTPQPEVTANEDSVDTPHPHQ